jgi:hypothetical protein
MSDELESLKNMPDSEIDTSDIPEVRDWTNAVRGKFYRIKTAIWVDPFGSMGETPEEQVKREQEHLESELGVRLNVHTPSHLGQIEEGTDLVLFDYGGMMAGNSLCEDNSRGLIRWAEDHPSALVVIISTFTYDNAFRYEIAEHLGLDRVPYHFAMPEGEQHKTPIHNITVQAWRENYIPDWFREAHGCKPWVDLNPKKEAREPIIAEPSDDEFLDYAATKMKKKSDAVLRKQQNDPALKARVAKTLANMGVRPPLSCGLTLPDQVFFQPKKGFLTYMKKHFRLRYVYDVGAGMGQVTAALRKAGFKTVNPIDLNRRENAVLEVNRADATNYPFKSGSLVMICRPCHGPFVESTIARALERKAGTIMYVGLTKNVKNDLGFYYRRFKKVAKSVGEDGEHIWVYQGKYHRK